MNYEKVIFPEDYFRNFIYDETIVHLEDRTTQQRLISLKQDLKMLIESAIWEEKEEKYNNSAYSSREELKQEIAINDFFRNLILNISKIETKNLLLKIIGQSKELLNGISILHYELLGEYSSGQQLLLSFYSRFLYAKNEILENEKYEFGISGETIIIFIDEGETSLHPEWQRVYFERMRTYLSDLFKDYTIQLILISHSPFVISDIPKENILFLTKDENGNANQIEIDTDETFGANIHELLINSFFMKSSMGEFVENKIKKIINFYYQVIENQSVESLIKLKREYQDYKLEFQYIVNSVGDEIIRNILTNHIESIEKKLFPKNYVDIRINELEEELKHLKLRKK